VGEKNLEAIVESFSSLAGLRAAEADRLEAIEGVGSTTAERIADELREPIGGFEWVGDEEGSE
jgi:ERCC4-type nuclease